MITKDMAHHFARAWVAAWNSHDLARVLEHYTDDVEMSSPFIERIAGEGRGVLKGKAAVGAYWARALERFPDLHFRLLGVHVGVGSLVIRYSSVGGITACETLEFTKEGKVHRASAHYGELDLEKAAEHRAWFFASHITPILNVSDVEASLAWFGKLGWRTCWSWSADGKGPATFASVGAGECEIFLCLNGQGGRGKGADTSTSGAKGQDDTVDKGVWMSVWVEDVDAVHAAGGEGGVDEELGAVLRSGAGENLKRVLVRGPTKGGAGTSVDWFDPGACGDPWWIEPFVEFKTVWHPSAV